jgi:hypothetical protein
MPNSEIGTVDLGPLWIRTLSDMVGGDGFGIETAPWLDALTCQGLMLRLI